MITGYWPKTNEMIRQFNANPDGSYQPLVAQHVDTGMGFERRTTFG